MSVAHQGDRVNKPFKCDLCEFSSHAKKYLKAHIFNCHENLAVHKGNCNGKIP